MKKAIFTILLTAAIFFGIPYIAVKLNGTYGDNRIDNRYIQVYIAETDKVEKMRIGDYLEGVVAAEMPASFYEEALKAQAVAARTYLIHKMNSADEETQNQHKGADICTDYTHCKAWKSRDQLKESWGSDYRTYKNKMHNAVEDTKDQLITYNGEPISAVFHSTSSGNTENAADVWGGEFPYLQSVSSEGDKFSPKYTSEKTVTKDEFEKTVSEKYPDFDPNKDFIGSFEKSAAGGLIYITLGGVKIKGTEFRSLFGLNSTNVVITENGGIYYFTVKGYGHGVGMSQYGANYMAENGSSYVDILTHYYTGTSVTVQQ